MKIIFSNLNSPKGYKRFLFNNSIGMFSVTDDFEIEIIRQMLKG